MGWTVHFITVAENGDVAEDALGALSTELEDWAGVAAGAPTLGRYEATFSIEEDTRDPVEVLRIAEPIYERAAERAGLPDGRIVTSTATTWDEHDRGLAESAYPELVGIAEVAAMLGISRQRASALQTRDGFPKPLTVLASGPVWPKPWLTRFAETWERKPGRPKTVKASGIRDSKSGKYVNVSASKRSSARSR